MLTSKALDVDSRMIIAHEIGERTIQAAIEFLPNLRSSLANRVQLNTDGHKAYYESVGLVFGSEVDYEQLIKLNGDADDAKENRYSPLKCIDTRKRRVFGNLDLEELSTFYVERHNLYMRKGIRRFTSLTNAFNKKLEYHLHMLSLFFVYNNFVKIHKMLRVTPATAAGMTDILPDVEWLIGLIDACKANPYRPAKYKK